MDKVFSTVIGLIFLCSVSFSQNVGIGTNTPNPSAKLEVSSNNSGFLPPRMTFTQRNTISNPATGLIIWCTDCLPKGELQVFNGSEWTNMTGGAAATNNAILQSVTIGTQIWSSKNLDVSTYRNGDPIPKVTDATEWTSLTTGAWCWYNNDSATYAATYGKLYNWYAVNDPRGLAPQGWHIPSDSEWNILIKYLNPTADTSCVDCWQGSNAGILLKSTDLWCCDGNGNNNSGFTALPAGRRNSGGIFDLFSSWGIFWSTRESGQFSAYQRLLNSSNNGMWRVQNYAKVDGISVRCIKN